MKWNRWHAFGVWVTGTLAAIVVIGVAPYAGLALAIASGIAVGVVNVLASRQSHARE